jgi:hypothetical protein
MHYTTHRGSYFAHRITLEGLGDDALAQSLSTARVDLEFSPSQNEMHLYEAVSTYLQRKDTIAFGDKPNALVTLVVRKILGSSTK